MTLSVHVRVFRLTDELTDYYDVLSSDNFVILHLQYFLLFVNQHLPLFSFMYASTCPTNYLFFSFIVIVFFQLSFD